MDKDACLGGTEDHQVRQPIVTGPFSNPDLLQIVAIDDDKPCEGCGACCMHLMAPPFDDDVDEFEALPQHLKDEIHSAWARMADDNDKTIKPGSPCIWFDTETRRCRNYEHRPPICWLFEPGCWVCNDNRESIGLPMLITKASFE